MTLDLSFDDVLKTTRAVRKRLDLTRPVEPEVLLECTRLAQQAPSGRNRQRWDFIFVTDPQTRADLAEIWRDGILHPAGPNPVGAYTREPYEGQHWQQMQSGVDHLLEHLAEVPVLLVPTLAIENRAELDTPTSQAGAWGSVLPAVWSFMLAARSRGLGTAWTTPHLHHERRAADLLGLDYETVLQCALIPVAYTIGTDFKPGTRVPPENVVHWNHW